MNGRLSNCPILRSRLFSNGTWFSLTNSIKKRARKQVARLVPRILPGKRMMSVFQYAT